MVKRLQTFVFYLSAKIYLSWSVERRRSFLAEMREAKKMPEDVIRFFEGLH